MPNPEQIIPSLSEEQRYHLLVDAVTDYAIYILDPTGIVSSWNSGAERIKGYKASEIIGDHFSRFYTQEDKLNGLPARVLAISASEGKFEGEGWRVRKDGSLLWAHVVIDPIFDETGVLIGFAKITRDLTERKESEDALKRSEEQFRRLVHSVTDYAIYMLDLDGNVTNWNAGAQRIKGYLPSEIIGQHFSRFYTPEDRAKGEPQKSLDTARQAGKFEKEGIRIRKDGTRFWASVVIDPIRDEGGEIVGFAKVTRDVTERREAQRALDEARERLTQSQKMEVIGRLTGGVAHDFNNLLMAVLGSLELLRKYLPNDQKASRLFDNAFKGAERGVSLTQRMLAFARRQELNPQTVDVPDLVRGMNDLLQRSLGSDVRIDTRFPLSLPDVKADANQLELALLNLVVNARDAMQQDGVITISGEEETVTHKRGNLAPGRYVRLSVADNGEGMDEVTLAQATEPFFTTKGVGKGTGLGLSMVHGLMEQSDGGLILKSKKGEGTTAELWFPVAQKIADDQIVTTPPEVTNRNQNASFRILVVDDDALVLMSTVSMLEDMGHTVFEAMSGSEALDMLREQSVDLVVTDQAMPKMTGDQLAKAIKEEWPEVTVILATGYAELPPGVAVSLSKLNKPFRQEDLARTIFNVMKKD